MKKVTLVHLDLGIGGAEQLVVSIACSLKEMGHAVKVVTSHHDLKHCFDETKKNGVLNGCIEIHGDWLPRHILGKCTALCAIIRMLYLSLILVLRRLLRRVKRRIFASAGASASDDDELIFLDGVSAPLPLFLLAGIPTIFYCHFPDKLLCTERGAAAKRVYRALIDGVEEFTTGCASVIVVNSNFTAGVFRESFPSLTKHRHLRPMVLYPTVENQEGKQRCIRDRRVLRKIAEKAKKNPAERGGELEEEEGSSIPYTAGFDFVFVSLNRYERKKNVALAIDALHRLKTAGTRTTDAGSVLLVVAGGYDVKVTENAEHLLELMLHCKSLGLGFSYAVAGHPEAAVPIPGKGPRSGLGAERAGEGEGGGWTFHVVFRTSISGEERERLLDRADALLYTPDREHFGIVPLEAMYAGTPAICVASGGPLETVLHGYTGYLCAQNAEEFGDAMGKFTTDSMTDTDRAKLLTSLREYKGQSAPASSSSSRSYLMGSIGRAHVQMNFTSACTPEKLSECISRCIRNHGRESSSETLALRKVLPVLLLNICIFIAVAIAFSIHSVGDSSWIHRRIF